MSLALVRLVKVAAEGRIGRIPARIYWFLVGKKTWIGAFFAVLWLVLRFLPPQPCDYCADWVTPVGWLAVVFLVVGLADKALREQPPIRPSWV